ISPEDAESIAKFFLYARRPPLPVPVAKKRIYTILEAGKWARETSSSVRGPHFWYKVGKLNFPYKCTFQRSSYHSFLVGAYAQRHRPDVFVLFPTLGKERCTHLARADGRINHQLPPDE
ncbi:hypothetical protein OS493_038158, partial [Desmophyllum pertusum]